MTSRDRTFLESLVLAMIVGVGGSLALASSCLGRSGPHRETADLTEDQGARTSAGGVPGEGPAGTTQVTGAELPAAPAAPATPAPAPAPQAQPPAPPPAEEAAPPASPGAPAAVSSEAGAPQATAAEAGAGIAAAAGDAGETASTAADAGAPSAQREAGAAEEARPPPVRFGMQTPLGAGGFISEPLPFGASALEPNHEAGAGPFTTERNVPAIPGP